MSVPTQRILRPGAATQPTTATFVTWRLSDSPGLKQPTNGAVLAAVEYGPRWLARPEIAALVEDVLFRAQDEWNLADLDAWTILPNQMHLIVRPRCSAQACLNVIREASETLCAQALDLRDRPFWQTGEIATPIESEQEMWRLLHAIRRSPVSEGLVSQPEQWFFSSFSRRFMDYSGAA